MDATPLYTIGHGGRTIESFLATLRQHDIAYVIDVRSKPYSRYQPDFSRSPLEGHLQSAGIRYVFMGDTLGGRPEDRALYTPDDKVDYDKLRLSDPFKEGIERLQKAHSQGLRVTLLCSEGRPENCHRSHLIGHTLELLGVAVEHISEQGDLLTQAEVMLRSQDYQQTLPGLEAPRTVSRKKYDQPTTSEDD